MSKKIIKKYAIDLIDEMRKDVDDAVKTTRPPIDLAEVVSISPEITIEPYTVNTSYNEDFLFFNIDPDTLSVGDTVILGITPASIPIVLGIADSNNEDPLDDPTIKALYEESFLLRENTSHWKASTASASTLPLTGNDNGDLRYSLNDNIIYRWDSDNNAWVPVTQPPQYAATTINGVNSPYTVTSNDRVILCDTTTGSVDLYLPDVHTSGDLVYIKDSGGNSSVNNITINAGGLDTIDGGPNAAIFTDYQSFQVVSDGNNWFIL